MESIQYELKRTRRRRSMALTVDPSGRVTVLAPRFALSYFIERFVQKRADWIRKTLAHFEALRQKHPIKQFVDGELFSVWGTDYPLEIIPASSHGPSSCELSNERLRLTIQAATPEKIKQALQKWYGLQMEQRLQTIVPQWAERMGVVPGRLKVADQKRRWGSCSRKGDLRFNWRLALMPPSLLEYVVVHELAHIQAHDHSKRFWSIVEQALPDFKVRRKWLRQNGGSLPL